VPDQVSWRQFSDALNQKCVSYNERGLTPENLHFLAEKLFKMSFPGGAVRDDYIVSWNAFCKENLQDRAFSFWEWFYAALRVTKDHLRGPWLEGSVVGFMSKIQVEEYLMPTAHGTFLLRFSDSELGSISIAWLRKNGVPNVLHIQPFNSKDLSARSLSDRLSDLEELKVRMFYFCHQFS
jgi:signal transducer and activator of transcription 5B